MLTDADFEISAQAIYVPDALEEAQKVTSRLATKRFSRTLKM